MTDSTWSALLRPDETLANTLLNAPQERTSLIPVGTRWDAVVISPLERGLAALDLMRLPREGGYHVIADYSKEELITWVNPAQSGACMGLPGVRVLRLGGWLLVGDTAPGTWAAAWLSGPVRGAATPNLIDPLELREAIRTADAERSCGTGSRRSS